MKKEHESWSEKNLRIYLGFLINSLAEHSVIDNDFYKKHFRDQVPFPDEIVKIYKENLIEALIEDNEFQ